MHDVLATCLLYFPSEHSEHRDVQRRHLAQLVEEEERNERERLTSVAYGPAPSIWDNPNTVRALLSGHVRLRLIFKPKSVGRGGTNSNYKQKR